MSIDEKSKSEAEQAAQRKEESFERFLGLQSTKFVLSFIPEGREADAVRIALRAAFDAGHDAGSGATASSFLQAMLATRPRPR